MQKESKAAAYDRKGKRRERKDVIKSESVFSMGPAVKSTSGQFQSGGAGMYIHSNIMSDRVSSGQICFTGALAAPVVDI